MRNIFTSATGILFCILISIGSCKQRGGTHHPPDGKDGAGTTTADPGVGANSEGTAGTSGTGNVEPPPPPPPVEKATLYYTSFTVSPQTAAPGSTISVSVNIHNDGPGPSSGANNVYIRVQTETLLSASDQELCRNFLRDVIPAGGDQQITVQCTAPSKAGLYKLYPQFEGLSAQENYVKTSFSAQLGVQ